MNRFSLMLLIIVVGLSFSCTRQDRLLKKPNFIVILADDLGYGDIGAYHHLYKGGDNKSIAHFYTPELDKLAKEGIICSRAYTGSWCAPSRQMLLSGKWVNYRYAYEPSNPWIGRMLRHEGYVTGMYGKSHGADAIARTTRYLDQEHTEFDQGLFFPGGARGYYLAPGEVLPGHTYQQDASFKAKGDEYITDVFTDGAIEFIKSNADSSFLLYIAYTAPHDPLHGKPEDLKTLFPEVFNGLADSVIRSTQPPSGISRANWEKYHYAAMVYALDRGLGKVREALLNENINERTFIFFTSDNGAIKGSNYPLTGHKWDVYEGGIRVPFIVWSNDIANSAQKGSVYDGLVSAADIVPSIMALAGDTQASDFDGVNIMPHLQGKQPPLQNHVFFYREALSHGQVSGADSLYSDNQRILLEAFIVDDQKYLRFGGHNHDKIYEQTILLPNVQGVSKPNKKISESILSNLPLTNMPHEAVDSLRKRRNDYIDDNEQNFTIRWSGHYGKEQLKGGKHSEK